MAAMPARSNEFQKLVYLVRHNLADGAIVTESKMLKDLVSGEDVEVDVFIEGRMAGQPMNISIECRDRSRRADRNWIHEMKAKHDRLPTHALILASAKGFTKSALELARSYGIETVWLDHVEDARFPGVLRQAMELWLRTISLTAERVVCTVEATDGFAAERVRVSADQNIVGFDHEYFCSAAELVRITLNAPGIGRRFLDQGTLDSKWFEIQYVPPVEGDMVIYLQKIEPRILRKISLIEISGPCVFTIGSFRVKRARIGSVHFAYGAATMFDRSVVFVATRDETGSEKMAANFSAANLKTTPSAASEHAAPGTAYKAIHSKRTQAPK